MTVKIILDLDQYGGIFKRVCSNGSLRKIGSIGNAGVALDFVDILRKIGCKVKINETILFEPE